MAESGNRLAVRAAAIAARCSDAYSWDRYGPEGFRKSVRRLLQRGYNDQEAEAILRSSWMRWAGDLFHKNGRGRYGDFPGNFITDYIDARPTICGQADVDVLVEHTFKRTPPAPQTKTPTPR